MQIALSDASADLLQSADKDTLVWERNLSQYVADAGDCSATDHGSQQPIMVIILAGTDSEGWRADNYTLLHR